MDPTEGAQLNSHDFIQTHLFLICCCLERLKYPICGKKGEILSHPEAAAAVLSCGNKQEIKLLLCVKSV